MNGGCCTEANNLKGTNTQSLSGWTFDGVDYGINSEATEISNPR